MDGWRLIVTAPLLLSDERLRARALVAAGPLAPLAASLTAELEPLLERGVYVPREKALLSRAGGRCAVDGMLLEFDPWNPREHRCPACGKSYSGELHERFWIYWYQLWLAERAVHAAVLAALECGRKERYAELSRRILISYAERYLEYPNRDNVLGPTRLFFSTYLESIWLLQICVAADLLARGGDQALAELVRDRIIEPSAAIIADYDEGGSNRQVWNNAALLAAALALGQPNDAERVVYGASGLVYHLGAGLLADGTWYEGENYHLFAHRGLWYGVAMAEAAGLELPPVLLDRFQEGFATPFAVALPDFTLPSRRDSQYAMSLRQWRFAELCELGLARARDKRLLGALNRLYGDDVSRRDTGRSRSSAEAERNTPPTKLSRADLGWRALLFALPELPAVNVYQPASVLLDGQGFAVLRRDGGRVYVALDYGHSGGGHGHPDRLNLLLMQDKTRWLDDMGTGSYVDPTLHWYRSTLAHNAPLVNGESQRRVHGQLAAFADHGGAGWVYADVPEIAPGVDAARTIVVMSGYLIDMLVWRAASPALIDLPLHFDAQVDDVSDRLKASIMSGGDGLEDGFRFLRDTACASVATDATVTFSAASGPREHLRGWSRAEGAGTTEWWRAVAPGPPGAGERPFWIVRVNGSGGDEMTPPHHGRHRLVLDWSGDLANVDFEGASTVVTMRDGSVHVHAPTENGWSVERRYAATRERIDLGGLVNTDDAPGAIDAAPAPFAPVVHDLEPGIERAYSLGEAHYRASEESWAEAGRPHAQVVLRFTGHGIEIAVDVHVGARALTFVLPGSTNLYDNEEADINGDGVQLYLGTASGDSAWVLVPDETSPTVRARPIAGWSRARPLSATWRRMPDGYRIEALIPLDDLTLENRALALDVIVNEKPEGRVRRRGQLVLSGRGGEGERVYLRGDRQERYRLRNFRLGDG